MSADAAPRGESTPMLCGVTLSKTNKQQEEEHPAVFETQRLQRNIVLYVDGYMGRHYRGKGARQR